MMQTRTLLLLPLFTVIAACTDTDSAPAQSISVLTDTETTQSNDFSGLTYAADGRLYASGHQNNGDDPQLVVARFNADGTPDQTFDGDGQIEINVAPGGNEFSRGIVELSNGDIIVAVSAADGNGGQQIQASDNPAVSGAREEGLSIALLRLDSSGTPVTSFGNNGKAEVVFGWADADNGDWPEPTFHSQDGFSHAGFPEDTIYDLALDDSGTSDRVVVFGYGPAPRDTTGGTQRLDRDRYIARVLADSGAPDPAFNSGKAHSWNSPGSFTDNSRRGFVEADGKIVSAGYTNLGGPRHHVVLIRLNEDGSQDASFRVADADDGLDEGGIVAFNPFQVDGGFAECYAAAQQSDGRYVTTGYGGATGDGVSSTLGYLTTVAQDLVSFRASDSSLDVAFGNAGTQAIQSEDQGRASAEDRGRDLVVLPDDRSVHVGRFGGTAAVFVLTADGQPDIRVSDDGIIELPHPSIGEQFFAAALSPDGRRVAVTSRDDSAGARLVIFEVEG